MGNIVAIVGRPNVGKSTLFNRLTGTRQAIVNEEAGTTRDRQYGKVEWTGKEFSLIDTGGWVVNSEDVFEEEINKQVKVAIEEADVILFVVDVLNGITDLDMEVAQILRRCKRPVIVVANKADNYDLHPASAEFYSFGLGDPFCISAINGSYTGDLLDKIVATLPEEKVEILEEELPRIAIIGRPNAGKSSLINAFIGEDRHIVTDIAGTTRDSIYTKYNKFGLNFYLVDTAGIRKKGKVNEDLEYYSVIRSIRAIENSDVCVLMLDATRGIESQDMNIFSLVQKNKKGLVVCVNKWDLIEDKSQKVMQKLIEYGKNYTEYKPIHDELKKLKNGWTSKRDKYEEAHRAELTLWNAASRYLHANLPKGTKTLPISEWEKEYATLSGQRTAEYTKLKETRAEVAELHNIRKCVDIALKADQPEQTRAKRHDLER